MTQLTFEFEEFEIYQEHPGNKTWDELIESKTILCEVDLVLVEYPQAGTPASLNYPGDPPEPAVYEVHEVRLYDVPAIAVAYGMGKPKQKESSLSLTLNETQFMTFFANGADVITNAYEWASEQEIEF